MHWESFTILHFGGGTTRVFFAFEVLHLIFREE